MYPQSRDVSCSSPDRFPCDAGPFPASYSSTTFYSHDTANHWERTLSTCARDDHL